MSNFKIYAFPIFLKKQLAYILQEKKHLQFHQETKNPSTPLRVTVNVMLSEVEA